MALKKLVIPSFKSESEEAAWWERHRAAVEADLRAAMRENKTVSLQEVMVHARQKKALLPVTIRLPNEDIATARQLADDKGVGYQTYIKLLLHEALQKAASRQTRRIKAAK
jgi:predicted DNA binding CopG/RHH family protein